MIISNKKSIESVGTYLMFLIPLILMVIIFHFLIAGKMDIIIMVFLIILIILLLIVYKLRYTEIENSGFVLTVKKRHPILNKGFVFPTLELPVDLLKDFQVRENAIYLEIINSSRNTGENRIFKIELKGFTLNQRKEIIRSINVKK